MSETVVILGAGASAHAGAPVMSTFLDVADDLRRQPQNVTAEWAIKFGRVFEAISSLQPVHAKAYIDLDNLESVFGALEMSQLLGRFPGVDTQQIDDLLVEFKALIATTLEQKIRFPLRDEHLYPTQSYADLVSIYHNLSERGRTCSFLTFNYDIALDYALSHECYEPQYCLGAQSIRGRCATLLKLHASVNWVQCAACGSVVPWSLSDFFQGRNYLSNEGDVRIPIASLLHQSGLQCCDQAIPGIPIIIPPTWNKSRYHSSIVSVWREAAEQLSDAENIFVIGYSLPDTDMFFRYLLALGLLGGRRIRRFWVFDTDQSGVVEGRFQALLGGDVRARFEYISDGFNAVPTRVQELLR